jgi:hypothetical protein
MTHCRQATIDHRHYLIGHPLDFGKDMGGDEHRFPFVS